MIIVIDPEMTLYITFALIALFVVTHGFEETNMSEKKIISKNEKDLQTETKSIKLVVQTI